MEQLRNVLGVSAPVTASDITRAYLAMDPGVPVSTVRWRIHSLLQHGLLYRTGRGLYRFGAARHFVPESYPLTKKISHIMHREYPLVFHCQWDVAMVNAFSHHLINFQAFFLDVEREAVSAVYHFLREHRKDVVLYSDVGSDLSDYDHYVIVRPLVTDAPLQQVDGLSMATLEKILVDLACDKIFHAFQDTEIKEIFNNAIDAYAVNLSSMLRYAGRRGRRKYIQDILNEIV